MKYILEIKPEYEDSFKGLMILGAKDSNLFVETLAVEELEELNSDYINDYYGDLQDTAYKKGLHDGESKCGYCNEYQRGLDAAWEAARKIADMWTRIDNDEMLAIFGITERIGHSTINSLFGKQTATEAIEKLKAYEEKQKADDKIVVGDEVNWLGDCFIVTRIFQPHNMKEQCDGIDDDGCVYHDVLMDDIEKTGRHFDIAKILEDMRND